MMGKNAREVREEGAGGRAFCPCALALALGGQNRALFGIGARQPVRPS
jgi:hypothetical protein